VCIAPVSISGAGLLVTAVKSADDGSGDLIVRFHEALGDRSTATLAVPDAALSQAWRAELTEEPGESLTVAGGRTELAVRPFEIVTVRLRWS
jgi:alpha-mannosidase